MDHFNGLLWWRWPALTVTACLCGCTDVSVEIKLKPTILHAIYKWTVTNIAVHNVFQVCYCSITLQYVLGWVDTNRRIHTYVKLLVSPYPLLFLPIFAMCRCTTTNGSKTVIVARWFNLFMYWHIQITCTYGQLNSLSSLDFPSVLNIDETSESCQTNRFYAGKEKLPVEIKITSDWACCTGHILSRHRVGIQALALSGWKIL